MSVLEDIEYNTRKNMEMSRTLLEKLESMESKEVAPSRPEVFINTGEVQRIINASAPTVLSLISSGLLVPIKNPRAKNNKFRLSEVEWIKMQKFKDLNPYDLRRLLDKKKVELP